MFEILRDGISSPSDVRYHEKLGKGKKVQQKGDLEASTDAQEAATAAMELSVHKIDDAKAIGGGDAAQETKTREVGI